MNPNQLYIKKIKRVKLFTIYLWILFLAFGIIFLKVAEAAEQKLYKGEGKRDPFVQLVNLETKQSTSGLLGVERLEEIVLEGVMQDPDPKKSVVVVNGSVMREGDEVGAVKILKISSDGVKLVVAGEEGFKALYQDEKKV